MRLTSVQDLKSELSSGPAIAEATARSLGTRALASAVSARLHSAHVREPESSTVALGVGKGKRKGDFWLSARIQLSRGAASLAERIAQRSRGECDVRIVPRVVKRQRRISFFQGRRRPLECGLSVGVIVPGLDHAGTLGCIVEDASAYYVLSNNHVLADVNQSDPGDVVAQPGSLDRRARPANLIGVLDRYVPISFRRSNVVDCAVAALFDDVDFWVGWNEAIPGSIRGVHAITVDDLGRTVRKAGRTTGITEGTITAVEVDRLRVDMGTDDRSRIAQFSDQIEVIGTDGSTFSTSGDSGSLIVDDAGRAVALLFAGGEDDSGTDITFANRIDRVLQLLGVTLTL